MRRKPAGKARENAVMLRLNPAEEALVTMAATWCGEPPATWGRRTLLAAARYTLRRARKQILLHQHRKANRAKTAS